VRGEENALSYVSEGGKDKVMVCVCARKEDEARGKGREGTRRRLGESGK